MRIKLSEILDVEKPLSELLSQNLPIKLSWHLSKLVNKVGSELKEFYNTRDRLIKKYGSESEPGKGDWSISPEDNAAIDAFKKEIQELVELEVELYNFEPISVRDLMATDIKISPIQLSSLSIFFKEE